MNNRFINIIALIVSSAVFVSGCDDDAFETPDSSDGDIPLNSGAVSQNNMTILSSDLTPAIFPDPNSNTFIFTELTITVNIGDRHNQILTDQHTVFFKTEWGLIEPSCITEDGSCSVKWTTSSANSAPTNHLNTIMAYTNGEESFTDVNGNGIFDNDDNATPSFDDIEEPYVDSNGNTSYDSGEPIVDVVNGNDPTGNNGVHDIGDMFFNGTGCTHSSLCSTVETSIAVWDDLQLNMNGPPPAIP